MTPSQHKTALPQAMAWFWLLADEGCALHVGVPFDMRSSIVAALGHITEGVDDPTGQVPLGVLGRLW